MLETMRKASKGWLAGILILLLVASFGFWGVQDMLNLNPTPRIAQVGDRLVTPEEFQNEFSRFLREMERQSQTTLSSAQAKALNLDREALDRMTTKLAILEKAKATGLDISQAQLIEAIRAIPGLAGSDGGVNMAVLQQVLSTAGLSQAQFMELIKGDILREQMIRTLLVGVAMPAGLDAALNRYRLERRVIEYVQIDPSRAGDIKDPDDAGLRKFYADNAGTRYSNPELRTFAAMVVSAKSIEAQIAVKEDEIKRIYDSRRRRYETPEKRVLEQIRFKSEAAARAGKAKLDAGTPFEEVAKAEGFKPEDIKLGEVSKTDTTIPAVAFTLPLNQVSEPVKGAFGWVVLRALSVTPGSVKTLEEVREEIVREIVEREARDKLFEVTQDFENDRGQGMSLEDAAKKHNLPIVTATVDQRGNDAEGKPAEGLSAALLQAAFDAERGYESDLTESEDGYFEFRLDDVKPAAKKPFEAIRAQVLEDWRAAELETRLKKLADELVKKGNTGTAMSSIASSLGVAALKSEPLSRYGDNSVFATATVSAAHEAKVGAFFSGPVTGGKSLVVARLAEVQYVPEPPESPARSMYSARLREAFAGDLGEQFATSVREEIGVTVDETRFQAFHTGE